MFVWCKGTNLNEKFERKKYKLFLFLADPQKFFFKEIKIFQRLFVTFCLYPLQIPNTKNRMQIPENRNLCFYLLHRNTANHQTETCKRTEKDLQNSFLLNILHQ